MIRILATPGQAFTMTALIARCAPLRTAVTSADGESPLRRTDRALLPSTVQEPVRTKLTLDPEKCERSPGPDP